MLKKLATLKITLVFAAAVAFYSSNYCLADNLLADNGFESSEPNGSFPDSGYWKKDWSGYEGAVCTPDSARTGNNGLRQATGNAKVSKTKIYTQSDTLAFNLAFTGFSQGVPVETGR